MFTHREQSHHVLAVDADVENMEMGMEMEEGVDANAQPQPLIDLDLERKMTEKEMTELTGNFID